MIEEDASESVVSPEDTEPFAERRDFAPGWRPEASEGFTFAFGRHNERKGKYGSYPVYTVAVRSGRARTENGFVEPPDEVAIHAMRDLLRYRFEPASFEEGEIGAVRYEGQPGGRGTPHRYRVSKWTGSEWREFDYEPPPDREPRRDAEGADDDSSIPF
jgi:hypothetical protein